MRKKLLAPATTDQRPAFRLALISALLLLPVCLNGVISGSPLRHLYAAGLVIALIQVIYCVVRLRRGRQHPPAGVQKR